MRRLKCGNAVAHNVFPIPQSVSQTGFFQILFRVPIMEQPKQAKEKVREYMERRQLERRQNARSPLHDPEQIRKEIGWDLVERRQGDRREKQ